MRSFDFFIKWMVENPGQAKETIACYKKTPKDVENMKRNEYDDYPETWPQKIAQDWVVEEKRPAWMDYAKQMSKKQKTPA